MIDNSFLRRRISDKREGSTASILDEMEGNRMVLPEFQRDYVWKMEDVKKLLVSIIAGRIVGGLLAWETSKQVRWVSMTSENIQNTFNTQFVYLLDGQQRMTSLYHAIKGDVFKKHDFSKILIDLDAETVEELIVVESKELALDRAIPFCDIFTDEAMAKHGDVVSINEKISLTLIANRVQDFNFSISTLKTDNIEEAIEQFNAVNTGGKKMSTHEIILSKIYSSDFKLKEEVKKLRTETESFKLTEKVVLETLAFSLLGSQRSSDMILMEFDEVKENWKAFAKALKTTTDYLTNCGFHHLKELPSKNNFIAVTRLLFEHNITHLTSTQHENVLRYILQTGISRRYTSGTYSAMYQDYQKLKAVMNQTTHDEFQLENVDNRFILENGNDFKKTSDSFRKVVLWMLENRTPLSLKNHMALKMVQTSNSKRYCMNLHHIYPKNFVKGQNVKYPVDHIVNICHVESGINQKEISDKKPSVYLAEFAQQNSKIQESCESLLFDYQIAIQDDYDKFFEDRLNKIRELIESHFPELK